MRAPPPAETSADGPPLSVADLTADHRAVFVPSDMEETEFTIDPDDLPIY